MVAKSSQRRSWLRLMLAVAMLGAAACAARRPARYGYGLPRHRPSLEWPVRTGRLTSGFGIRHGVMHDGVDIAAPAGTPVHAAAAGKVIYAGWLRGYGNVLIVQHRNHYVTVYAHNSANLVRDGQWVRRGQIIADVGRTGRTTGPNLHFEVRHNNVASNPLAYLPPPAGGAARLARHAGS